MPKNAAIPFFKGGKDVTGTVTAAVTGKRFVSVVPGGRGNAPSIAPLTAAGSRAFGVAGHDMATDGHVHVLREGIVPVTAGADLTAGTDVEASADGTAVPHADGIRVGTCTANAALGADAAIALSL